MVNRVIVINNIKFNIDEEITDDEKILRILNENINDFEDEAYIVCMDDEGSLIIW